MQYLLAPLEEHYDSGFGAIAEAFFRAARTLAENSDDDKIGLVHLPETFLKRHAIELFLKSGILIIHRRLKLPFGPKSFDSDPMLRVGDRWKPLYKTHELSELYSYWKALISEHRDSLTRICKFQPDWSIPHSLDEHIETLATIDPTTAYFRYPITDKRDNDAHKSSFKETSLEELFPLPPVEEKKIMSLITKDESGNWKRAFRFDSSTNQKHSEAAKAAAEVLSEFHAMMRIELTDGW